MSRILSKAERLCQNSFRLKNFEARESTRGSAAEKQSPSACLDGVYTGGR
jgi:hypothetical protein